MATLQQSIVALNFSTADPAAAVAEADLPKQWGLPDLADMIGVVMPMAGTIVGISVTAAPASGDTITVTPRVATSKAGAGAVNAASLACQVTNAAPANSVLVTKDQADAQFAAGQFVSLRYITTTASAFTPVDVNVTLWISTGREDV